MSDSQKLKAVERQAAQEQFLFETETIAVIDQTFYDLLSQEGVVINGSRARKDLRLDKKDDACRALFEACSYLLTHCGDEARAQIQALDISPTALCTTYHQFVNELLGDGCYWGKVVMLVSASSLLAALVHRNGDAQSVESVHQWMDDQLHSWYSQALDRTASWMSWPFGQV